LERDGFHLDANPGSSQHPDESIDRKELYFAPNKIAHARLSYAKGDCGSCLREISIFDQLLCDCD
jgi:hypothetical protein